MLQKTCKQLIEKLLSNESYVRNIRRLICLQHKKLHILTYIHNTRTRKPMVATTNQSFTQSSSLVKNENKLDINTSTSSHQSTIFCLSSGKGKCGIAVIRVSGQACRQVLKDMAQFHHMPIPRQAVLRKIVDSGNGVVIDKGLVIFFPAPHSFTGEDCVEFHLHGGPAVVSALLCALHSIPGCREAHPGEFTKRAFMNGKLDMTEVEGLGDLIHAETEVQRRQALRQMDGDLSQLYQGWRADIIKCVADLEAFIDFSEDQDIEEHVVESVKSRVGKLRLEISRHLHDNRQGERLRDGVQVVILGEPNVGKSSLMNALSQRPAAIVTDVAGTTRDIIETHLNIAGYPVLLSDTAGLRDTADKVEKEGVIRARKRAEQADVKVVVLDLQQWQNCKNNNRKSSITEFVISQINSLGLQLYQASASSLQILNADLSDSDSTPQLVDEEYCQTIIVLNKLDLVQGNTLEDLKSIDNKVLNCAVGSCLEAQSGRELEPNSPVDFPSVCCVSCTTGEGMQEFLAILESKLKIMCGDPLAGSPSLTQARHRSHLTKCLADLEQFGQMTPADDFVIASEALRRVLREIGKLTGKITTEEILDVIFRDFCIGK
ncbi:tRNA modification GTPase GTPBP3, mitochondrial-like isoform X2 [Dreissena polymorpha]|nr:tRNA modification GTPase GTPBP3, mitochondrial-like isoform X2 [Dreissena polymorpha]XP_052255641.1 tRNA modification GTPase GTPBP3, mitochondrial-like isoform X2 [Dreissena polymorpha]